MIAWKPARSTHATRVIVFYPISGKKIGTPLVRPSRVWSVSKGSFLSKWHQLGPDTAIRCSHWSGYDLTSTVGVKRLEDLISETRPLHVWISCECGPYSPLQRINTRDPGQCERLEEKRRVARLQYDGGIQVAKRARLCGADVHFELSERRDTWKLPAIETFVSQLGLRKATCNRCTVGLRVGEHRQLSCKA